MNKKIKKKGKIKREVKNEIRKKEPEKKKDYRGCSEGEYLSECSGSTKQYKATD